ncbi:TrkH family potassium uptake protein [Thalassobaculum sp.]|uniref:TrkH family potassium uptake protein n=1 Tax=Thalassobaculum sp. TaxID=2022740 RepID=UPI003B5A8403
MLDLRVVAHILGWVMISVAAMLLLPAGLDWVRADADWPAFVVAAVISALFGALMILANSMPERPELSLRQAFVLIASGWVTVCLFGSIPLMAYGLSITDAVFETMSGITTTGSTVLTGLDTMPEGILLWRALLHWIGGIGIIAIAVMILPYLRVGGMQIYKMETSVHEGEKASFTSRILLRLSVVYIGLTILCGAVYWVLGMSFFDAVTHSMATISTGGYSTHDASFGYFQSPWLHWASIVFMISGAIPFILFVRATQGNLRALVRDEQVRGFLGFLAVFSVLTAFWLMSRDETLGFGQALTLTAFNITAIVTTTGFATADYTLWGNGAIGLFLLLMFVGGCSGSTSGSIKIYRYQVLWLFVRAHLKRLFSPHRIVVLRYNGATLGEDVPLSVLAFLAVFIATIAIFTVVLAFLGLDLITAYTAAVTAISNVGPGLGSIIGPAGNFQSLPDPAKWVLVIAMLAGRLEVLALLVFFDRDFWRG